MVQNRTSMGKSCPVIESAALLGQAVLMADLIGILEIKFGQLISDCRRQLDAGNAQHHAGGHRTDLMRERGHLERGHEDHGHERELHDQSVARELEKRVSSCIFWSCTSIDGVMSR